MTTTINQQRHWPISPTLCACGDRFRNPERHLAHARAFIAKYASGPNWRQRGCAVTAFVGPGHELSYHTGLALNPALNKVICSCGWSRYVSQGGKSRASREHVRGVIKGVIGLT